MKARTMRQALDSLAEKGLVRIIKPFTRNGEGVVELLAYDTLIVPNQTRRGSRATRTTSAQQVPNIDPTSTQQTRNRAYDQGKQGIGRSEAARKGESDEGGALDPPVDVAQGDDRRCRRCNGFNGPTARWEEACGCPFEEPGELAS
jgi:hypothetical protein